MSDIEKAKPQAVEPVTGLVAQDQFTFRQLTSGWHRIHRGDYPKGRLLIEYGFDVDFAKRTNQTPHFAVTGQIIPYRCREPHAFGCLHEEIELNFPRWKQYTRWHLFTWPGDPMHYLPNARYWFESAVGVSQWERKDYDKAPLPIFRNHIVMDILADDQYWLDYLIGQYRGPWESDEVKSMVRRELASEESPLLGWLKARHSALVYAFTQDMQKLKVLTIKDSDGFYGVLNGFLHSCTSCHKHIAYACPTCGRGACCGPSCHIHPGECGFPSVLLDDLRKEQSE